MTATADDHHDPSVINELLIDFHQKLLNQWNAEAEADQFIAEMRTSHPEAFALWVEDHVVDIVVRFLRDLERRDRDAARSLRKKQLIKTRAMQHLREERRREAEARGETWDETEDLNDEANEVQSIFELVVNATVDGVTKRIGAWTAEDMKYISRQYFKVGAGFIRQGEVVNTLAEVFDTKRQLLFRKAIAVGNTRDAQKYSDPTLTVAEVLTEEEVTEIWVDNDSEAQATP